MLNIKQTHAQILTATPELVDWLLSLNTHNRTIKKSHVAYLAKQIQTGHWFLTNQGIGISREGVLTDGQHRLLALQQCGYPPAALLVVTGLEPEAQSAVDTHAKRSQADVIRLLLNRTVSNQAVAAINVSLRVSSDGLRFLNATAGATDTWVVADEIAAHSDLLATLFSACGTNLRASVMAALIDYAKRYSLDHACHLGGQIRDGANLDKDDPAYRLRQTLDKSRKMSGSSASVLIYALTVSACIAHAKGEKLHLLRPATSWARLPKPTQPLAA